MVSRKYRFLKQCGYILTVLLLASCGGDSKKFDAVSYINAKVSQIKFINNKIEV